MATTRGQVQSTASKKLVDLRIDELFFVYAGLETQERRDRIGRANPQDDQIE